MDSPRERAAMIKRAQEDQLAQLPVNNLYIVLWIRDDPPRPNDFHWAYYFHTISSRGTKYHVKDIGNGWIADHAPTGGIFKSLFLHVVIKLRVFCRRSTRWLIRPCVFMMGN
ncbi:hypothetical protein BJY04DRAFT_188099 [Aspergillus karnatakaensis]|uniref:uncharacterized protein n=1 Tax=Aspergillus karnatakaensis TaxID=1810916 RepID=UPI003CCE528B